MLSSVRSQDALEDQPASPFLTELLFPLPAHRRTALGILLWWESRRLVYNVIVGATGVVTLAVLTIAVLAAPASDFGPPAVTPWIPVLAYGILANVCYTLGPIIEATLEHAWKDRILPIGPALFRQGLAFSIGLTLLPIPIVIAFEMARGMRFLFGWW